MTAKSPKIQIQQTATPARRALSAFASIGLLLFLALRLEAPALIACALLGLLWTSGYAARRGARSLSVTIEAPAQRGHAGEPLPIRLTLRNRSRIFPVAHPCIDAQEAGSAHSVSFRYGGMIAPRATVSVTIFPIPTRRGPQTFTVTGWRTLFPFALYETRLSVHSESPRFLVWPAKGAINAPALLRRFMADSSEATALRPQRRQENLQLSSTREYTAGDPRRSINWKLSAKLDKLMVAEERPTPQRRLTLQLDTTVELWPNKLRFESMLTLVTSLVLQLLARDRLEAVILNGQRYPFRQRKDAERFLDALSVAKPLRHGAAAPALPVRRRLRIIPSLETGIALVPAQPPGRAASTT